VAQVLADHPLVAAEARQPDGEAVARFGLEEQQVLADAPVRGPARHVDVERDRGVRVEDIGAEELLGFLLHVPRGDGGQRRGRRRRGLGMALSGAAGCGGSRAVPSAGAERAVPSPWALAQAAATEARATSEIVYCREAVIIVSSADFP
jgi:hypothetical protein